MVDLSEGVEYKNTVCMETKMYAFIVLFYILWITNMNMFAFFTIFHIFMNLVIIAIQNILFEHISVLPSRVDISVQLSSLHVQVTHFINFTNLLAS